MRFFFTVTLGFYVLLGALCPMQLQAATFVRETSMPMMSSMDHTNVMLSQAHSEKGAAHADCGEEDHCTLGEQVDSAGADVVQEVLSMSVIDVVMTDVIAVTFGEGLVMATVDRPPPLAMLSTVVLRQ